MRNLVSKHLSPLKEHLKRQHGGAMLWFLIAVPVLTIVLGFSFETTELSHTARWFQEALNRSTKAAAFQVTAPSYAIALPSIDPIEAENAFRALLAHNMYLNPTDLTPTPGNKRVVEAPAYTLFIHNGPYPYPYQNAEYGIDTVIQEPTAVAMVNMKFNSGVTGRKITVRRYAIAKVVEKE